MYTDESDVLEFDITHRYKVLREVIDKSVRRFGVCAVQAHYRHSHGQTRDGISTDIIRGDVSAPARLMSGQQKPQSAVLVIQPQAAAHGVTLTAANTVVWWGPTSSLETYAQANARVHRSGQKHKCTVVQLHGSPVEKRVCTLLDNRIDVHTKMIDLYKEILD